MSNEKVHALREELTSKIIASLEQGRIPWQCPWVTPFNPVTGTVYSGVNRLRLGFAGEEKGYDDPRWVTYLQAKKAGWQVKAGAKATQIEHWQWYDGFTIVDSCEVDENSDTDGVLIKLNSKKPTCRIYSVFNAAQIEGMPELVKEPVETIVVAERIIKNSSAKIDHICGNEAFYNKTSDVIIMPKRDFFKSAEGYYGTILHELAHWTGHKSRFNRNLSCSFGSAEYAKEELRAELASCFMNHELGTTADYINNAAYIQSWIQALKKDNSEIFKAAADAEKISNYLLAFKDVSVQREQEVA
jgi:antirestriction protein ArdC